MPTYVDDCVEQECETRPTKIAFQPHQGCESTGNILGFCSVRQSTFGRNRDRSAAVLMNRKQDRNIQLCEVKLGCWLSLPLCVHSLNSSQDTRQRALLQSSRAMQDTALAHKLKENICCILLIRQIKEKKYMYVCNGCGCDATDKVVLLKPAGKNSASSKVLQRGWRTKISCTWRLGKDS